MDPTITELRKYLEKHKVSNLEDAKRDVVPVVKDIAKRAERQDQKFRIGEIGFTGSIYQKAKINAPDEFDFDLPLSELEINDISETLDGISEGKMFSILKGLLSIKEKSSSYNKLK